MIDLSGQLINKYQYLIAIYSFLLSAGFVALSLRPARWLGWVDQPDARKRHLCPVPLTGGVAMCAAFCLGLLLLPDKPRACWTLVICLLLLVAIGLYDDLRSTKPLIRFSFHISATLLMAFEGGILLNDLGNLFGSGNFILGDAAIFFTVFSVVGIINALNMIDGLDGLAGGTALIATIWLIFLSLIAPIKDYSISNTLFLLAMTIAGFLCFNFRFPWRKRAYVFMGDAGSTMLGFILSWFMVYLSQDIGQQQNIIKPMTAIWILALPLLDAVTVIIRRIRFKRSPFAADRQHLHHLLIDRGLPHQQVVAILLGSSIIFGAVGVVTLHLDIPEYIQFYAFIALFLLYYRKTTCLWMRNIGI